MQQQILSGFAWQSATKLVVQAFAWISTIMVIRVLTPSDYGIVALSGLFTGFLIEVGGVGLGQGLVQKDTVTRETEDSIFYLSVCLAIVFYSILYMCAPYIAAYFELEILRDVIRLGGLGLILQSLAVVPFSVCMRRMNFRYRSINEMVRNFVGMLTVLVLAYTGFGLWSLIWGYLAKRFVSTVLYLAWYKRVPGLVFNKDETLEVLNFGYKVMANKIMIFLSGRADVFFIARYLGESILGYYNLAMQIAIAPNDKIGSIFSQVAFPALSRMQQDRAAFSKIYLDMHRYLLIITFPMFVGLALTIEDIILLLLTDKWVFAAPLVQGFCILNLLRASAILMGPALYALGNANEMVKYTAASSICLPVSFFIGAQFSIFGVIAAWLLVYPLLYMLLYFYCQRQIQYSFKDYLVSMKPASVATLVMAAAVILLNNYFYIDNIVLRLMVTISVGVIFYIAAFFVFFRGQVDEVKQQLVLIISKRRTRNAEKRAGAETQ